MISLRRVLRRLTRRQPTTAQEPHSRGCTCATPCPPRGGHRADDGAAPATVPVPPMRHADLQHAAPVDLHRPDLQRRGWRFWRRTDVDASTREWLDAMRAPVLSADDAAWQQREVAQNRQWGADLYRLRWVLAERTEEMRVLLVSVEDELLAGAR